MTDSQRTQSQDSSQIRIEDHFSEPSTQGTSSLYHDPSSYYSQTVAYGTNIIVPDAQKQIHLFIMQFPNTEKPIYLEKIKEMSIKEKYDLNIDMTDINQHDSSLYKKLIDFPLEMIQIFDNVVKEVFQTVCPDVDDRAVSRVVVRPFNLLEVKTVRDLQPTDIDRLVSVRGMITRCSHVIPDLSTAVLICRVCGHTVNIPVSDGRIFEPEKCQSCSGHYTYEIEHNLSSYADRQHCRLQESPESIPQGEAPQTVAAVLFDELVDFSRPGDRVELTGVWRAAPARVNPRVRTVHSVYRTYLDVVHIKITTHPNRTIDRNMTADDFTEEQRDKFMRLASDPEIYNKLVRSFAPSIWQMDDVKKGLLCLLFGGSDFSNRQDLNVLLIGDPATAKSQLIQYTHKSSPRGLYTSGKGSSAVGLTASVIRDPDTGEFVLESGALVLSDKGVCCIDEFDKMSDTARSVLHEVMEQQTVSVAKAGIVCTLNARAAIVACANPRDSSYNPKLSVVENISLPPTLLSRFDLVYIVLDQVDPVRDQELAKHIVGMYASREKVYAELSVADLTEYIRFAKTFSPQLSEEAGKRLVDGYIEMRSMGGRNVVSATPRQLESCIRISQAWAKMRLADYVEEGDVDVALELMKEALHQSATDPSTGLIDMDLLATGTSHERRRRISSLEKEIIRLLQAVGIGQSVSQVLSSLRSVVGNDVAENDVSEALFALEAEGEVLLAVEGGRPTRVNLIKRR